MIVASSQIFSAVLSILDERDYWWCKHEQKYKLWLYKQHRNETSATKVSCGWWYMSTTIIRKLERLLVLFQKSWNILQMLCFLKLFQDGMRICLKLIVAAKWQVTMVTNKMVVCIVRHKLQYIFINLPWCVLIINSELPKMLFAVSGSVLRLGLFILTVDGRWLHCEPSFFIHISMINE